MDPTTQYALAYALTTTAGLRGFLTLFAAGLAAHLGWIHPVHAFAWLGSTGTLVVLGAFAIAEIVGDKVPAVDHALHFIQTAARPAAGAILVGTTLHTGNNAELYGLMALGALNALLVHGTSATTRLASTATTGGLANPLLSFAEDGIAVGGIVLAFVAPVVAGILALALVLGAILVARRIVMRRRVAAQSAVK